MGATAAETVLIQMTTLLVQYASLVHQNQIISEDLFLKQHVLQDSDPGKPLSILSGAFIKQVFLGYWRYQVFLNNTVALIASSRALPAKTSEDISGSSKIEPGSHFGSTGEGKKKAYEAEKTVKPPRLTQWDKMTFGILIYCTAMRWSGSCDLGTSDLIQLLDAGTRVIGHNAFMTSGNESKRSESSLGLAMVNNLIRSLLYSHEDSDELKKYSQTASTCLETWKSILEESFLVNKIIAKLDIYKRSPSDLNLMNIYLHELERIRKVGSRPQRDMNAPKTFTKTIPFQLTLPKPRKLPVPKLYPQMEHAKPVPKSHYVILPDSIKTMEKDRIRRREELRKRLEQEKPLRVLRETTKKPNSETSNPDESTSAQSQSDILEEGSTDAQNKAKKKFGVVPGFVYRTKFSVRPNLATVMREEALVQKKIQDASKKLEAELESGVAGTLTNQELTAREEMLREMDRLAKEERSAELKLKVRLAREEAIAARNLFLETTKQEASEFKSIAKAQLEKAKMEDIYTVQEKAKIVEQVQDARVNIIEAKQKIVNERQKNAVQIELEKKERAKQKAAQEAEILNQKLELIRQIRAMEKEQSEFDLSVRTKKVLDLTQPSGYGILTELSIIELQERLALLKVRAVEEELQKRQKVNESKQHRAKLLQEKLSAIEAFRNEEKVKARTGVSSLRSVSGLSGSDTAMSLRSAIDEDLFYKQVVGKYALQQYKEIDVNVGRIGKLERRLQKLKEKRLKEAPAVK